MSSEFGTGLGPAGTNTKSRVQLINSTSGLVKTDLDRLQFPSLLHGLEVIVSLAILRFLLPVNAIVFLFSDPPPTHIYTLFTQLQIPLRFQRTSLLFVFSSPSTYCARAVDASSSMNFTSSTLYAIAFLFAIATVRAQDCTPSTDSYETDTQGSDGTSAGSDTYQVENSC
jgi:hypothetical protein